MTTSLRRPSVVLIYTLFIVLLLITVIPFYMVIVNSTHSNFDIVTKLNLTIGSHLAENYARMQSNIDIWRGFFNSLAIAVPYTVLTGYFGALTAYGFAKFTFRGKPLLFGIVLGSMMIPSQLSIMGFYKLNLSLGLLDTYVPFILPGIANASVVFFLRGFIEQSIPDSMLEAARLEGCSEIRLFNQFILPCILPGIATMSIFSFVANWNNYLGPLIILTSNAKYTMPVMIAMIKGLYLSNYGAMYLAVAISVVPIIIVYAFCSRFIIGGLTSGADK